MTVQRTESRERRKSASHFRNLLTWQKSQELAAEIIGLSLGLRPDRANDALVRQLVRAAGSVPANIAEGYGRYSRAAYRSHLSYARGSAHEVQSWLDLLARSGDLQPEEAATLDARYEELVKLLTSRMKDLDAGPSVRDKGRVYDL
ncbi:MAG TPA: four helix bundle protein [Dehalococcoidia bacterium]|nr:four helix bundle protein [Dehalococcoidia bacterium]